MWVLLSLWLQSMVEMVAENYHNIWAKKKKTELISKGALLSSSRTSRPAQLQGL